MSEKLQRNGNGPPIISMTDAQKWYGSYHALRSVNLSVKTGERIVVCGPSGSGKSTLIRCINGLEDFSEGTIVVDGFVPKTRSKEMNAVRREVGMVFQQFNLFPHLTVLENCILAPLRSRNNA